MTSSPCLRTILAALLGVSAQPFARAQRPPEQLSSSQIEHRLQKLGVVGSALYIAAHPDDENTRLISWLANGKQVRTAYLSLTRGDGGQNLIGPELGDALGILRTQELLEARRIDGGEQFFTRAVDFGYSKIPEETFQKWGHQEVLADVVRVVRTFRPDVILTRFATDGSGGHGHHTASALMAREAFDLAADPTAFPEQLAEGLATWRAKRLFFNASTWWNPDLESEVAKDPTNWVRVDVGGFDPLLGTSYTELAGRSRSQHKSQGFGAAETRGSLTEYLRLEAGDPLQGNDLFGGLDLGWERFPGAEEPGRRVRDLLRDFDARAPESSVMSLAELAGALDAVARADTSPEGLARAWAEHHAREARELILQACGAVIEVRAKAPSLAAGESLSLELAGMLRRPAGALALVDMVGPQASAFEPDEQPLPCNVPRTRTLTFNPGADQPFDQPYWLSSPHGALYRPDTSGGLHGIEPVAPAQATFRGHVRLPDGSEIEVRRAAMHTWVERVAGQRTRIVDLTPIASIDPRDTVVVVRGERSIVEVDVESLCGDVAGELVARGPEGWTVLPERTALQLKSGERGRVACAVLRSPASQAGPLRMEFQSPKGSSDRTLHRIDYPHILPQVWSTPAEVRLVPLDVAVDVERVGYVAGVGDDMPRALERLGLSVERIDPATAQAADLERCDAIVTGIRAYNAVPELARFQDQLLAYVEGGGTLLMQYNTASEDLVLPAARLGPYPFALTRERVTVEEAAPTFVLPEHPLLRSPNVLGPADFDGWVQERGLYFAGRPDKAYAAPIAWNDPGEAPSTGALISADYGRGRFTYTGISLFRQLPAGVPGAYRLLANLISRRSPRH